MYIMQLCNEVIWLMVIVIQKGVSEGGEYLSSLLLLTSKRVTQRQKEIQMVDTKTTYVRNMLN